jgi:hypothetical protein
MATSIQKEGLMHMHIKWQTSLQKEEDEDSDARVVMKDDAEEDTYSMSDKMNEDSDATVTMEDDPKQNTNSQSGDAIKVKRSKHVKDMGICGTVRREDEIYG